MTVRTFLTGAAILATAALPLAVTPPVQADSLQPLHLVNAAWETCLDSNAAGQAALNDCANSATQGWAMPDTGPTTNGTTRIKDAADAECLRTPLAVSTTCTLTGYQSGAELWVVQDAGDGRVFLKNVQLAGANCLSSDGDGTLVLRECDPDDAHTQWYLQW